MTLQAPAGYDAALHDAGVLWREDLAVLRLWGRDPVRMLHGLITNDLQNAPPERAVYAAMLTPKGRMIAELRAHRAPAEGTPELWVEVPRAALAGTAEQLKKFMPPMFARWADVSEEVGVLGLYGPQATERLGRALDEAVPALAEDDTRRVSYQGDPLLVVGSRYTGGPGFEIIGARTALAALHEALSQSEPATPEISADALEVLRIEAGRPRYGSELGETTIPTEAYETTGLMPRAVSFTKGCYTGQEVIVRIAHRGHVNRHLRGLLLGDAEAPAPETPLVSPETGKEIGRVTSSARSPRLGQTVALGYVRREFEPGSEVLLGAGGPSATVVALPFPTPPAA
jgi:folate-binding protein YgfZ